MEPSQGSRVYFYISFNEKEEAKWLGCRWDPQLKKWYCVDIDREFEESNINKCIKRWPKPPPFKFINNDKINLADIPDDKRGDTRW